MEVILLHFLKKQDYFNPNIEKLLNLKKKKEDEDIGWGENLKEEEYDPWNDLI